MITISPGHWHIGTGARDLIDEVTEARRVVDRVIAILHSWKIPVNHVEDNTSKNQRQNLTYLVTQHNKTSRQLDVSVHFNASSGRQIKGIGTEVLYYDAKDLATKVSKAISSASGLIDRGAKQRKELAFLANTNKPAILIEVCFVNSTVDTAIYNRDFEKICQAIANELAKAVGKTLKPSTIVEDKKEVKPVELLNDTGRAELRELLKSAREAKIIGSVHTDEKIVKYTDVELLSYQAAVINRTFGK